GGFTYHVWASAWVHVQQFSPLCSTWNTVAAYSSALLPHPSFQHPDWANGKSFPHLPLCSTWNTLKAPSGERPLTQASDALCFYLGNSNVFGESALYFPLPLKYRSAEWHFVRLNVHV